MTSSRTHGQDTQLSTILEQVAASGSINLSWQQLFYTIKYLLLNLLLISGSGESGDSFFSGVYELIVGGMLYKINSVVGIEVNSCLELLPCVNRSFVVLALN